MAGESMSAETYVRHVAIPAALSMLPTKMDTQDARSMLMAIGLQESRLIHRRQVGGPARGFSQFELNGVRGVLTHQASAPHARDILRAMNYGETAEIAFGALENNDVLNFALSRLLLWTHPKALPGKGEHQEAWDMYLWLWRPGKPHRATWDAFYDRAWQ